MEPRKIGPGRFVAVVGPSGSGKDSIIRGARTVLASSRHIVFPRRFITREGGDGFEDHIPISPSAFREAEAAGMFALSWEAHGLRYGIPLEADDMVRAGMTVVVNGSRAVIPEMRERYARLLVISVTVEPRLLAERLARRGRETPERIAQRIARAAEPTPAGADVVEIANNGPIEEAVDGFCAALADTRCR